MTSNALANLNRTMEALEPQLRWQRQLESLCQPLMKTSIADMARAWEQFDNVLSDESLDQVRKVARSFHTLDGNDAFNPVMPSAAKVASNFLSRSRATTSLDRLLGHDAAKNFQTVRSALGPDFADRLSMAKSFAPAIAASEEQREAIFRNFSTTHSIADNLQGTQSLKDIFAGQKGLFPDYFDHVQDVIKKVTAKEIYGGLDRERVLRNAFKILWEEIEEAEPDEPTFTEDVRQWIIANSVALQFFAAFMVEMSGISESYDIAFELVSLLICAMIQMASTPRNTFTLH